MMKMTPTEFSCVGRIKFSSQVSLRVGWKLSPRPPQKLTTLQCPSCRWARGSLLRGRAWKKSVASRFPVL